MLASGLSYKLQEPEMTQKLVELRFLLSHGHTLGVGLPESEANDVIRKWNERWYQLTDKETITGTCKASNSQWTVEIADVRAIRTYPLQQAPIGPPPLPGQSFLGMSGVN